jgi:predicted RNA-binding protein with TRAM domain
MFGNSYGNDRKEMTPLYRKAENTMLKLTILAETETELPRIDGFVVFVSGAKVGDEVKIRVNSTRRNFGFADIVE